MTGYRYPAKLLLIFLITNRNIHIFTSDYNTDIMKKIEKIKGYWKFRTNKIGILIDTASEKKEEKLWCF